ncbi:TIGR01777 family oxidoreductase [Cesiribacter andamanensis]|uniref:Epimerase family protein n=1 Tax=Cesiribacter andamanensis AMV16 TaxID=1279009 RepID=M7N087_9BACT|nr:TIGR01777 family oxidoreductase [Cesiribacter andamanensis]EMR00636.1 Epimerase family protein [Cesiribacter andamanensis AMV16]
MHNKLIIAGGSGFLGKLAATHFSTLGWDVVILSRKAYPSKGPIRYAQWNGSTLGPWQQELEGARLLLNLSGKSVDCRYTPANRSEILLSRLNSTRCLSQAVAACQQPPALWINASSATWYRHAHTPQDEAAGEMGEGFSVEVVEEWERAFFAQRQPGVRKVALRLGFVLGPQESAFVPLKLMARLGIGRLGPGTQYMSWLHQQDYLNMLQFLLDTPAAEGVFNATAPHPVRNRHFMAALRQALGQPLALPLPAPLLELGSWLIRTETELVLKSRYVVPRRLQALGYRFAYPQIEEALQQLTITPQTS